jgi:hypothetical protein
MEESLKYIRSFDYQQNYITNPDVLDKFSLISVANQYKNLYDEL